MAHRNPPHGNDEKPRGPTGPLVPFPSQFLDIGEPASSQSFHQRFLRKLINHWQLVAGCIAFIGIVSAALVLSWIRSSRTSESVASTLNEETSKATRPKKDAAASRPPLVLPEENKWEGEAPAEPPHREPFSSEPRPPAAPWSPQTPDELALWQKLPSRTRKDLEGILTKAGQEGASFLSAASPRRLSRQALAALAALGRENELAALFESFSSTVEQKSVSTSPSLLPGKETEGPEGSTQTVSPTWSSNWLAQEEEVPLEKLLALLTADGQDRTALLGWRSTLEGEKEATALRLAALKRVTEAGFPEAHTTLLALPAVLSTPTDGAQNSAANPMVWANLYASLLRQDSVLSRYVLATELLNQPRVEQRTLVVEALAAYGTMNHRGLLVLGQADPDLGIRTRAKEILSAQQ